VSDRKGGDRKKAEPVTVFPVGYNQVRLQLPEWYLGFLDEEAPRFAMKRGEFLSFLVLRASGMVNATRGDACPKVKIPADVGKLVPYVWNLRPDLRAKLDELRGEDVPVGLWVKLAIRDWLGASTALRVGTR
jgi:hypothetical protein